jgi:hypothetical protein
MGLTSCVYCGHRVSSEAYKCPRCGEPPKGIRCKLCSGFVKEAEKHPALYCDAQFAYHQSCVLQVFTPPATVNCPDCNAAVHTTMTANDLAIGTNVPPCPTCGKPSVFGGCGNCSGCRLPIYAALHSYYIKGEDRGYPEWQYHETCAKRHHLKMSGSKYHAVGSTSGCLIFVCALPAAVLFAAAIAKAAG